MGKKKPSADVVVSTEKPTFDEIAMFVRIMKTIRGRRLLRVPVESIRELGREAGISHAAIIDNLNRLDKKYGTSLIDRQSFTLSSVGESVLKWGESLLDLYNSGHSIVPQTEPVHFKIGFDAFPASIVIGELIGYISENFEPKPSIEVVQVDPVEMGSKLANGELHFWIGPLAEFMIPSDPLLKFVQLTRSLPIMAYRTANGSESEQETRFFATNDVGSPDFDLSSVNLASYDVELPSGENCLAFMSMYSNSKRPTRYFGYAYRLPHKHDYKKKYLREFTCDDKVDGILYQLPPGITAKLTEKIGHPLYLIRRVDTPFDPLSTYRLIVDVFCNIAYQNWGSPD